MSSIYERRDNGDGSYSTNTAITDSDAILPMGVEYRKQKMIPAHSSTNVLPNAWNTISGWIDTDGFESIAVTLKNDAATLAKANIDWSHDQSVTAGSEQVIAPASNFSLAGAVPTKARYAKISIQNQDGAAAHVFFSWAYLKA
jgi:hypothetical protein